MFSPELITAIKAVKDATEQHRVDWRKVNQFAFETGPFDSQMLRTEKYFFEDEESPCINFTVFNSDKSAILSETVRCADAVIPNEFILLSELYQAIENCYRQKEEVIASPALDHLAQIMHHRVQD